MTKLSKAPELQQYLRAKFAAGPSLWDGYSEAFKNMYGVDPRRGYDAQALGERMNDTYQWGKTPIGALRMAKEQDTENLPYAEQEKRWQQANPQMSAEDARKATESAVTNYAKDVINLPRTVAIGGQLMDENLGTHTGMNPDQITPKDTAAYHKRIVDNVNNSYPGQAVRETGRVINDVFDPSGGEHPLRYAAGKFMDRANANAAPATNVVPDAPLAKPESTSQLPLSGNAMYGLGGAGAGAILGATMSGKGKRGRNALLGAGIGGAGGLLANYLMNQQGQKKSAADFGGAVAALTYKKKAADAGVKQALDLTPLKDFGSQTMQKAKDLYHKLPLATIEGAGLGGIGGAALGGTAGLIDPGEYNEHDEYGNVIGKKRRSRFMGAMRGSTIGKIVGTGVGGLAGNLHPEGMHNLNKHISDYGSQAYDYMRNAVGYPQKARSLPDGTQHLRPQQEELILPTGR